MLSNLIFFPVGENTLLLLLIRYCSECKVEWGACKRVSGGYGRKERRVW